MNFKALNFSMPADYEGQKCGEDEQSAPISTGDLHDQCSGATEQRDRDRTHELPSCDQNEVIRQGLVAPCLLWASSQVALVFQCSNQYSPSRLPLAVLKSVSDVRTQVPV
jgi:hypothetical protein